MDRTSWNIASATRPKDWDAFVEILKLSAAEHSKLTLVGAVVTGGPGCNNYGPMIGGPEMAAENFVGQVTMALMPSKYGRCDGDPALEEGKFANQLAE